MKRIITGVLIVFAWILLLFKTPLYLFAAVITILAILILREYFSITAAGPEKCCTPLLLAAGTLPLLAAFSSDVPMTAAGTVIALIGVLLITLFRFRLIEAPFEFISKAVFGLIYVPFFCAHIILIRAEPGGAQWLLMLTAITAGSDTGAYYAGTLLGKHKLCPRISPGKTVEGFVGGIVAGVATALLLAYFLMAEVSPLTISLLAVVLTCIGVVGDLTESVIKRSAGVKDSGTLLPGHGGLLDRVDSLLLTAPVLFYLLHFHFPGI
jgi:phosphatidate cytidylyltransferase